MPEEARERTDKEIRKLKMMSPMAAEATVVRNYIDWMLSLPWEDYKEENDDIVDAPRRSSTRTTSASRSRRSASSSTWPSSPSST